MLVLTRKSDESVMLGDDIEVKVLAVRGDQVSLGFSAPIELRINRKEICEAIEAANREAVKVPKAASLGALSRFLSEKKG